MKIHKDLNNIEIKNAVVTNGTFDGVHLGHQKIIKQLKDIAKKTDGESAIISYHPHPRLVLYPDNNDLRLLLSIEEKIEILEKNGIDHLILLPFTKELSMLTAKEFVKSVIVDALNTKKLVIGYDHHFGKNREGDFDELKKISLEYDFEVEEISKQVIEDVAISSTKIRNSLLTGDVTTAKTYLNYPYFISGSIVEGDKIGRTLGFATANIKANDPLKLIPADGVYAVEVLLDNKKYQGMLYIGVRPTINGRSRTVEVNIFDFNQEVYGKEIRVYFLERIRGEAKFSSLNKLKAGIAKDEKAVRAYFQS